MSEGAWRRPGRACAAPGPLRCAAGRRPSLDAGVKIIRTCRSVRSSEGIGGDVGWGGLSGQSGGWMEAVLNRSPEIRDTKEWAAPSTQVTSQLNRTHKSTSPKSRRKRNTHYKEQILKRDSPGSAGGPCLHLFFCLAQDLVLGQTSWRSECDVPLGCWPCFGLLPFWRRRLFGRRRM